MDSWLGANREKLRGTLGDIASLQAKLKATKKSADQQWNVFAALQATARILDMPLNATCLKRYGICIEARTLPRQRNEAPTREEEVEEIELDEEEEGDHTPKRQRRELTRRDERVDRHAAAVLQWENMGSSQTIRVISSFLSLQGIHDLGLTCHPLHRLLLLSSPSGDGNAAGTIASFVGAPLHTQRCFKHFVGSATSTAGTHPRIISLTISPKDCSYYLQQHLNEAFLLGRFQRLQVLEMKGPARMPLSFLFSEIARHLASGQVPHLRTLSLEAPQGLNDDDLENYGGVINMSSFFHHLHNACTQGHLGNLDQLTLGRGLGWREG